MTDADLDSLVDDVARSYEQDGFREGIRFQSPKAYLSGVEHGIGPGSASGALAGYIEGVCLAFTSAISGCNVPTRLRTELKAIIAAVHTIRPLDTHSTSEHPVATDKVHTVAPIVVRDILARYQVIQRLAAQFTRSESPASAEVCDVFVTACKALLSLPSADALARSLGIVDHVAAASTSRLDY